MHMHFQYLVEDQSGAALIRILMQKIVELYPNATYDCKGFRGIGGFTRKNTIKETKTGKLLNDLATYLRGFDRSLQRFSRDRWIHKKKYDKRNKNRKVTQRFSNILARL